MVYLLELIIIDKIDTIKRTWDCEYRFSSIGETNRYQSIDLYRLLSIISIDFRWSIIIDWARREYIHWLISLRTQTYFRLWRYFSAETSDSRKYVCVRRLLHWLISIKFFRRPKFVMTFDKEDTIAGTFQNYILIESDHTKIDHVRCRRRSSYCMVILFQLWYSIKSYNGRCWRSALSLVYR